MPTDAQTATKMTEAERNKVIAELDAEAIRSELEPLNERSSVVTLSDDVLRNIESADDVLAMFAEAGLTVEEASETLGNGFTLLDKKGKRKLVDVPFVLVSWKFSVGEHGPFVIAYGVTVERNPLKFVLVDGSTGIYKQLRSETERRIAVGHPAINAGWKCAGLRVSEYEYTDPATGELKPAETVYISSEAV